MSEILDRMSANRSENFEYGFGIMKKNHDYLIVFIFNNLKFYFSPQLLF